MVSDLNLLINCAIARLKNDILTDPWFNPRAKKYMNGPKRIPFKNL